MTRGYAAGIIFRYFYSMIFRVISFRDHIKVSECTVERSKNWLKHTVAHGNQAISMSASSLTWRSCQTRRNSGRLSCYPYLSITTSRGLKILQMLQISTILIRPFKWCIDPVVRNPLVTFQYITSSM